MTLPRMRILILSQWFDPEPTFKGMLFARRLAAAGHQVSVLTGFPNYPGGRVYEGYRIRAVQREVVHGIEIVRVPLYPSHDSSGSRRVLNYLSFAASAAIAAVLLKRPDVAYVYHPPGTIALPAAVLRWLRNVPHVYDVQDLWPDTLAATGMISRRSVLRAVGVAMGVAYRDATRIAVLSPGFKRRLVERGIAPGKIAVIPNWADESSIETGTPSSERRQELGFDGFTVTFAGNMGAAQHLDTVLDAAAKLSDEPVRLALIGGGIDRPRLQARAAELGLDNVRFMERRPINEIGEVLATSDALLVHLRPDPLFEITIPSKTQAYMLVGRPILMGVGGDAADLVATAGAGLTFTPGDAEALAGAVRAMLAMTPEQRSLMADRARDYYRAHLSLEHGTRRFEELLHEASLIRPHFMAAKRAFDILAAAAGLVIGSVPMAVVAVAVAVKLGRPVIFTQTRPGRHERPFSMLKFRTMTDARDANGEPLPDAERLTPLGVMLRRSSLDELPELWNVLKGDMSIVGPRPLLMRYTRFFTDEERVRLQVRPGITGLAQTHGRNEVSWDERLGADVRYVRTLSLRNEIRILLDTVILVLRRDGVVADAESIMQNLDVERAGRGAT